MSSNSTRRQANALHESTHQQANEFFLFNSINGTTTLNGQGNLIEQQQHQSTNVSASSLLMINTPAKPHAKHDSPSPKESKLDSIINRLKTNKTTNELTPLSIMPTNQRPTAPGRFLPYQQQVAVCNITQNSQGTQTLMSASNLEVKPLPINLKSDLLKDIKLSVNNQSIDLTCLLARLVNNVNKTSINHNNSLNNTATNANGSDTSVEKNLFLNDELFRKQLQRIDSEIKMIAAHSKNKLYSLNSFPTMSKSSGSPGLSDLPPTLPPPPPYNPTRSPYSTGQSPSTVELSARSNNTKTNFRSSQLIDKSRVITNARKPNQAQSLLAPNVVGHNLPTSNCGRQYKPARHPLEHEQHSFISKIRVDPKNSLDISLTYTNRPSPYTRPHQSPNRLSHQYEPLLLKTPNNNRQISSTNRPAQTPTQTISSATVKVVVPPVKCAHSFSQNDCQDELSTETSKKLVDEYNELNEKLQEFQKVTSISFKELGSEPKSRQKLSDNDDLARSLRDLSSSPNENMVQLNKQDPIRCENQESISKIHIPTFKVHRDGIIPMPSKQKQEMIIATSFGLKLNNFFDRERAQPRNDTMDLDQYANCLNLVRKLDFEREKEFKKQNHTPKLRMPIGERPLRLRRLRKDQFNVPASVSYKAARKLGLK